MTMMICIDPFGNKPINFVSAYMYNILKQLIGVDIILKLLSRKLSIVLSG